MVRQRKNHDSKGEGFRRSGGWRHRPRRHRRRCLLRHEVVEKKRQPDGFCRSFPLGFSCSSRRKRNRISRKLTNEDYTATAHGKTEAALGLVWFVSDEGEKNRIRATSQVPARHHTRVFSREQVPLQYPKSESSTVTLVLINNSNSTNLKNDTSEKLT